MIERPLALTLVAASMLAACKDPPAPPLPASATASAPPPPASSAPPPPPAPIDGALPDAVPRPLDRRAECFKEGCTLAHVVPDEVRPALSDGAPAVIWEEMIGERATLVFPRDEVVEVMGVVLDGSLDLTAMEEAPKGNTVGSRWAAFRAPGGGITLNGTAGKAVRIALVVAVAERDKSLGAHLDQRDKPGAPPSWSWKTRPRRIETLSFTERPDLTWAGGAAHARIGWEDERAAAVIDVLRFSPNAGVAEHTHDHEWEILAVLEGAGTMIQKPAGVEKRSVVKPGAVMSIPAGQKHAFQPSGGPPLLAIQVYAPPGPEQRFKSFSMGPQAAPNPAPPSSAQHAGPIPAPPPAPPASAVPPSPSPSAAPPSSAR